MLGWSGRRARQLRQPEVQDLDQPILRHHHVLGLQVPVNDPRLVCLGQSVGNLC